MSEFQNLHATGSRAAVERALQLWKDRGVFLVARPDPLKPDRYQVTSFDGDVHQDLTVKEARMLVVGAASVWFRLEHVRAAAHGVVDSWEGPHLAEAVNELDVRLLAMPDA